MTCLAPCRLKHGYQSEKQARAGSGKQPTHDSGQGYAQCRFEYLANCDCQRCPENASTKAGKCRLNGSQIQNHPNRSSPNAEQGLLLTTLDCSRASYS